MTKGFLVDANNCIGCRTCVVACMDANRYQLGMSFRQVKSFATGAYPDPAMYHVSFIPAEGQKSPMTGEKRNCDYCASIQELGEQPACVASCPMRAIEYGEIDDLREKHCGKAIETEFPALKTCGSLRVGQIFIVKECMRDEDFDEVLM